MRSLLLVALLVSTVLAGCTGSNPEPVCDEDIVLCNPTEYFGDHFCEQNDVRPRIYAPDTDGPDTDPTPWVLGDFWTYSITIDGEDLGDTKLVYYDLQDSGSHYMVGTPTRDEALQHAMFSTNPVIGRVHKTLYSPHESGSHADMFHFPLCAGSTWSDEFFGTDFQFTTQKASLTLPGGRVDPLAFRIDGTAANGSTIRHTYSPAAKWFTNIDLNRADGRQVTLQLTETGTGYSGSAFFLRGQNDLVEAIDSSGAGNVVSSAITRIDDGYQTLGIWMDVERVSGSGRVELHVNSPAGESVACVGFAGGGLSGGATSCPAGPLLVEVPFQDGDWEYQIVRPLGSGQTHLAGELRLVSIQDRSCTLGGNCGA